MLSLRSSFPSFAPHPTHLPLEHPPPREPEHSLCGLVLPLHKNKLSLARDRVDSDNHAVHAIHDAAMNVLLVEIVLEVLVVLLSCCEHTGEGRNDEQTFVRYSTACCVPPAILAHLLLP